MKGSHKDIFCQLLNPKKKMSKEKGAYMNWFFELVKSNTVSMIVLFTHDTNKKIEKCEQIMLTLTFYELNQLGLCIKC